MILVIIFRRVVSFLAIDDEMRATTGIVLSSEAVFVDVVVVKVVVDVVLVVVVVVVLVVVVVVAGVKKDILIVLKQINDLLTSCSSSEELSFETRMMLECFIISLILSFPCLFDLTRFGGILSIFFEFE